MEALTRASIRDRNHGDEARKMPWAELRFFFVQLAQETAAHRLEIKVVLAREPAVGLSSFGLTVAA
jgi:hypothetical protein